MDVIVEERDADSCSTTTYHGAQRHPDATHLPGRVGGGVIGFLRRTFLPVGYPESVRAEYTEYQIWDTVQALCSYLRNVLTTYSVLGGLGVGKEGATVLAATLQWVLRDGSGMLGGLLFSSVCANRFDANLKCWRLFADVINNVGLTLDLIAHLCPAFFMYIICVANVCKAMCGISAGATKGALTAHFAVRPDNFGDVQAKEGAQETLVTILGMCCGVGFTSWFQDSLYAQWVAFAVLTLLHCVANYRGVRCLQLPSLNAARLQIAAERHVAAATGSRSATRMRRSSSVRPGAHGAGSACPAVPEGFDASISIPAINAAEPLLRRLPHDIVLGARWKDAAEGEDVKQWLDEPRCRGENWMLQLRGQRILAVLEEGANPLSAMYHAVQWAHAGKPVRFDPAGCKDFLHRMDEAGWATDRVLGCGRWRCRIRMKDQ